VGQSLSVVPTRVTHPNLGITTVTKLKLLWLFLGSLKARAPPWWNPPIIGSCLSPRLRPPIEYPPVVKVSSTCWCRLPGVLVPALGLTPLACFFLISLALRRPPIIRSCLSHRLQPPIENPPVVKLPSTWWRKLAIHGRFQGVTSTPSGTHLDISLALRCLLLFSSHVGYND